EQTASGPEKSEMLPMFQEVFDLDRHIIRELAELPMQSRYYGHGMCGHVEEVGISECDVLRAPRHLAANVFQHDISLHDTECTIIDRHNRAVTTKVLATSRRFCVADSFCLAWCQLQTGVTLQSRQVHAGGQQET